MSDDPGKGLVDLMRNRGRHLTHHHHPIRARKIRLDLLQTLLRALALGNVAADRGQGKPPSTAFIGNKKNVLPHRYRFTGLEVPKEGLTLPAAVLEDRRQDIVVESFPFLLRHIV